MLGRTLTPEVVPFQVKRMSDSGLVWMRSVPWAEVRGVIGHLVLQTQMGHRVAVPPLHPATATTAATATARMRP